MAHSEVSAGQESRNAPVGPLVTIGLPVRNGAETVEHCLGSLRAQTYRDFRLIVSDNASSDATKDIVTRHMGEDARIEWVANAVNVGALENFRRVLALCESPLFMWVAADDHYEPAFLARLVAELEANPDAAVAMSAVRRVWSEDRNDVIRWSGSADPGRMGPMRLAANLAAGKPYHIFIYGLHRTHAIREVFRGIPSVQGLDRLLMCHHALAFRWRYVDEVLYTRHVTAVPHAVRHGDERRVALRRGSAWSPAVLMCAAVPFFLRSRVIPWHRKLYVPLLTVVFAKRAAVGLLGTVYVRLRGSK